jgi:hypothetical protein
MRYKIKAPNQKAYDEIKAALAGRVKVDLPRRLMVSVEGLTPDDEKLVEKHGASFSVEHQYEIDTAKPQRLNRPSP